MDSLPLATPYTWVDDTDDQASRILTRKRNGAGFNYLEHKRHQSVQAKHILQTLVRGKGAATETQDTSHLPSSALFTFGKLARVIDEDDDEDGEEDAVDEDTIVQLAQGGNVSLLLSLYKQIDSAAAPVSAKELIQSSCALTVNAGCTPGWLDAKDMVLAALYFMSSTKATLTSSSDNTSSAGAAASVLVLPLIEVDNPMEEQLEKRSYRKAATASWQEYKNNVLFAELQLIFDSSPVARDKFVPPLQHGLDEEGPLLQKGIVPVTSAPKRKGPAPGYRRKSNTTTATTTAD